MKILALILILVLGQLLIAQSLALTAPVRAIDIGNLKQLFIDDFIIDSQRGLTRVMHQPERHPGNPIIVGNNTWERWQIEVNGRAALYDEGTKEFRLYYGCNSEDASAPTRFRYKVCYAVSKDGLHWTKPNLGQVEWEGSRQNNILKWGENWMRRPNVIKDVHDPDPNRRYKMIYVDSMGERFPVTKAYSKDGIHWRLNGDGKPWFWRPTSVNLLGWDPRIKQYVMYPRVSDRPDVVGRSTSADFVTWSEPQPIMAPEPTEVGKDFKGHAAFLYQNVYIGWLWVFDRDYAADAELSFSRDDLRWRRVFPGQSFFPRGQPGSWDNERIMPVAPVVYRDKLWIYYYGSNLPNTEEAQRRAGTGWVENGKRRQSAIGLATLRLDGFVSLDAGHVQGELTTKLLEIPGGSLTVNANVRGELRVEILDERGQPFPGYAAADCKALRGDSIRQIVRWKGKADLNKLAGKSAKLRFLLRDGSLYAFRFRSGL